MSASKDKTVRFWDTDTHSCKSTLCLQDKNLNSVSCMPNGQLVIAKDNQIKFYNHLKEELDSKTLTGHNKTIYATCPLQDGNLLSAG